MVIELQVVGTGLINPESYAFIKDFGLPTFLVLILLSFVILISRRDEKRQLKTDMRYESLVNRFISDLKQISDDHTTALAKLDEVHERTVDRISTEHVSAISKISDEHAETIDKLIIEIKPIVQQLILIAERLDKHDDKSDKALEYIYESQKKHSVQKQKLSQPIDTETEEPTQRSITAKRGN